MPSANANRDGRASARRITIAASSCNKIRTKTPIGMCNTNMWKRPRNSTMSGHFLPGSPATSGSAINASATTVAQAVTSISILRVRMGDGFSDMILFLTARSFGAFRVAGKLEFQLCPS